MYDLIIIGGGPAGLTATIYAIRKRLNVLLISKDLGGMTNYHLSLPWAEDYQVIRGLEVVNKFKSELEYLKFARHMDTVEHIEREGEGFAIHTKSGTRFDTRAIILATGTRTKRMGVPGEKDYIMRGLCFSALSYAPLFIDKTTAVIGYSDLALRSAAELSTVAKHVTLIGPTQTALDTPMGAKLRRSPNVTIREGYQVVEVQGNGYAERIVVKSPAGAQEVVTADGTFVELGLVPNTQMIAGLVELDPEGRIKVDCMARASLPGIFAAGDVTTNYAEQVLIAVGDGAKAALSAYDYLLPKL
jgi:alkyl hydroperoxide reductase subunit F